MKSANAHPEAGDRLPEILVAGDESAAVADDELQVVVPETDQSEGERHQQRDQHEAIGHVRPQHRARADRHQDQRAAHRRRARLRQMCLRTVVANTLTDLPVRQRADHPRTDDEGDRQCRERCENGAQRQVAEHPESGVPFAQVVCQIEQHVWLLLVLLSGRWLPSGAAAASAADTRSRRFARDPLISTATPAVSELPRVGDQRIDVAKPLRAATERLDRKMRMLADRKQPFDSCLTRITTYFGMKLIGAVASSSMSPSTSQRLPLKPRSASSPALSELGLAL